MVNNQLPKDGLNGAGAGGVAGAGRAAPSAIPWCALRCTRWESCTHWESAVAITSAFDALLSGTAPAHMHAEDGQTVCFIWACLGGLYLYALCGVHLRLFAYYPSVCMCARVPDSGLPDARTYSDAIL